LTNSFRPAWEKEGEEEGLLLFSGSAGRGGGGYALHPREDFRQLSQRVSQKKGKRGTPTLPPPEEEGKGREKV